MIFTAPDQKATAFPMELHGYKFCVLYQGYSMSDALDSRPSTDTVMKDTIAVPGSGITRIRFVADNPGKILFNSYINNFNS
jgi:FtsP/CotA-like multicopper oxidase with cupredoxin domain